MATEITTLAGEEVHKVENKYAGKKTPLISHRASGTLLQNMFTPFGKISTTVKSILILSQLAVVLLILQFANYDVIPTPLSVLSALMDLFRDTIFIDNLISTFGEIFFAMGISIFITMVITYLAKIPFFSILALFASKCRFLTLPSLVFLFTFLTANVGHMKSDLLIFGIVPYFTTSFMAATNLRQQEVDKPFLNKMNAWEALWEVVIVGKMDSLFEVMRQNFAIAWAMITMVEGLAMSEGGIGTMLVKNNKYFHLPPIFAMLLVILIIGILFDFLFSIARKSLFPYIPKAN